MLSLSQVCCQDSCMHASSEMHFMKVKKVLRYIKGTQKLGVWYTKGSNVHLIDYIDSDWGGSLDNIKRTSRYIFSLGSRVISFYNQSKVHSYYRCC